jgi:hypothetical protein
MLPTRHLPVVLAVLLAVAASCAGETDQGPSGTGGSTAGSGGSSNGGGGAGGTNTAGTGGSNTAGTGGSNVGGGGAGAGGTNAAGRGGAGAGGSNVGGGGAGGSNVGGGGAGAGGSNVGGAGGAIAGRGGNGGTGGSVAGSGGGGGAGAGGRGGGGGGRGGAGGGGGRGGTGAGGGGTGGATTPPTKTLRVFWVVPTDVSFDQRYVDGIAGVVLEAQRYYMAELGVTFRVNNPIVEVVTGEHNASWYQNTPIGGDSNWYTVENMQAELRRRFSLNEPDSRWKIVAEISSPGSGGGGNGWVTLTKHDADGAAGLDNPNESMNRWYGGMVHEMGHMFGLPDSSSTDGTPMSGSFYSYPNCHFSTAQKNSILNASQNSGFLN